MNKTINLILFASAALLILSCGQRRATSKPSNQTWSVAPKDSSIHIPYFEYKGTDEEVFRLCDAKLTSLDAMLAAFPDSTEDFLEETTPASRAFYYPGEDIKDSEIVKNVQLRYNHAALLYRILHSYEWFRRMTTGIDEEETPITKKDTLDWIRASRPEIDQRTIKKAFPDVNASARAIKFLRAYERFDGDDSDESPFSKAFNEYKNGINAFPELADEKDLDHFEEVFWEWYDKKNVIPEIDRIVRMNMNGYEGEKPSESQLENLKQAIESEKDIDRRTVLALEYVKFNSWEGVLLLGEILESKIYTKYLLEAWISWRANVQMDHSPSSFSVIANNYYDYLRTICLDTMLRHCLETNDKNAECLIENLIFCENVHRMGSIAGNSSFATAANLSYGEFIHPRLLDND